MQLLIVKDSKIKHLINKLEDKVSELEQEVCWRKKLEKQLYDSQESLQIALDGANLGMWDWNVQTGEVKFNEKWTQFLGYSIEAFLPHVSTWAKLLHPDDRTKIMAALKANLNGATEFYENEHRLKEKAGKWRWVLARGKVVSRDDSGKALRHVGTFLDITDRVESKKALEASHVRMEKQVEARTAELLKANHQLEDEILLRNKIEVALRESEERFRMLAENAKNMIYRMSLPDGNYEYISPAAIDIFGYTPQDFYQTPILIKQIMHPDWGDYFDEKWAQLQEGKSSPVYEYQIIRKTGEVRWIYQKNVLIRDHDGNPSAIEGICTDITELKQAESALAKQNEHLDQLVADRTSKLQVVTEALREEKERYRIILESIEDGYFEVDLAGNLTFFNKALVAILGYPASELKGKNYQTFMNEAFGRKTYQRFNQVFKNGRSAKAFDWEFIRKDGTGRYLDTLVSPIKDVDENIIGFRGVTRDVSERQLMQKFLAESEERFRLIFESAPVGIFSYDKNGIILACNQAFADIGGSTFGKLIGFNLLKGANSKLVQDAIKISLTGSQGHYEGAYTLLTGGRKSYIKADFVPVFSEDKSLTGGMCVVEDITERKQAEEELKKKDQKYRGIFNESIAAIYMFDAEKNFTDSNKAGLDLLGYSIEELLGMKISDVDADPVAVLKAHDQLLSGGKIINYEHQLKRKDGKIIMVLNNSKPLTTIDGVVVGMQSTLIDVTERTIAEDALRKSRKQMRELSKHLQTSREQERAAIAREIHDDLGQSLTAIKMDIAWQKSKLPEDRAELHIKAEDTIFLVDSAIQTVKRISSELRPGLLDDLGLSAAIEWQAKEYQKRSNINMDVIIEPEEIVLGEELSIAIFRVCQETLTNVIRHAGATDVWVRLTKNSQMLALEVTDNGCGISDQSIAKKNSFGLLGMRERVHAIGGKINISRIEKGGTKVAVMVPLGGIN